MSLARNAVRQARRLIGRFRPDPLDEQTVALLSRVLRPDSNCIDVGAHRGAILKHILRLAPRGHHIAIEPLPRFANQLRSRFPQVTVHEAALANGDGTVEFQHVETNPAYSGLKRRRYDRPGERVRAIQVVVRRLDDLIEQDHQVDFLKIDVEGGELGVLQGARRTLAGNKPTILFEHGLGAADFYGTKPRDLWDLLVNEVGLQIYTLPGWLSQEPALNLAAMENEFQRCGCYMFVATPAS